MHDLMHRDMSLFLHVSFLYTSHRLQNGLRCYANSAENLPWKNAARANVERVVCSSPFCMYGVCVCMCLLDVVRLFAYAFVIVVVVVMFVYVCICLCLSVCLSLWMDAWM